MLIVQKYGGSSVANKERIFNVASKISASYNEGNRLIVILSAQGDTTDHLIEKAEEISGNPCSRELDMLLSAGEQQSVALMAMALKELNCPAISLNAYQVGILTTDSYSNARIKEISTSRLYKELFENNRIVLVTGFQGCTDTGDVTTLGRGGSDTTAVAIAAAVSADLCEIYTDVVGIFTADPRMITGARKLEAISYDEMLEMASLGANVLHNRSVELAKKYSVHLVVRSSLSDEEGTLIRGVTSLERTHVSGLTVDKNVARISVIEVQDKPGMAFKLFSLLADAGIVVDTIIQSIGRNKTKDISFTVAKAQLGHALSLLEEDAQSIEYSHISHDSSIAKLSLVGVGMAANPKVAAQMFGALYEAGVNIDMITTSEMKISVLVNESDVVRGLDSVHDKFFKLIGV